MSNGQHRKTSIPLHFRFAHSKRVVPALENASRAVATPLRSKKRPTSILIPQDSPVHRKLPVAVQPEWTPIEISNFPSKLRRSDLIDLLQGYNISPEFDDFPITPRFTRPFRATILAASVKEAKRMVKDLDGNLVGARKIAVRMKDMTEKERKAYQIQDMADQIKTSIINTARIYRPALADAILEVREIVKDGSYFAFLQKRDPVTVSNTPEAHALEIRNMAEWNYVSGFIFELELEMDDGTTSPRLEALKGLQGSLENQGVLETVWRKWSGSQLLMSDGV